MFHRSRVVASLVAAVFVAGVGALTAAPAFAADSASTTVASSTAISSSPAISSSLAISSSPTTLVPTPVRADTTDQQPQSPASDRSVTDRRVSEIPVAERTTNEANPLMLVAGLGVLFAAILVVVRSGNQSSAGREP